jgi:hypothetical protein
MSSSQSQPGFDSADLADAGRFSPPTGGAWRSVPTRAPTAARKPVGSAPSTPAADRRQQSPYQPSQTPTSNPCQSPHQRSYSPPRTQVSPQRNQYSPPRHYSGPNRAVPPADNPLGIAAAPPRPKPTPLQFDHDISSPGPPSSYPTTTSNTPLFALFRKGLHERSDSQSNLLQGGYPAGYQPYHAGYRDPSPPFAYANYGAAAPPVSPKWLAWFYRYWLPHYNMYLFLFVGIMFAVGHHLFYKTQDGKPAQEQLRVLRYGATLAFISKASLAAAAIVAFRQRVWMTVRRKVMSLGAVDSLFAAAEDVSAMFNVELFRQAKLAMVLALYVWCTPLVVILTSETLSVQSKSTAEETKCPSVRTLNFTLEAIKDFRRSETIDGFPITSVSYYNTSRSDDDKGRPTGFDFWDQPSFQFEHVVQLSTLLREPVVRKNPGLDVCGSGWDCSFSIKFTGPGYKCTEVANGVGQAPRKLGKAVAPFNPDIIAPTGNFTFVALSMLGEYAHPQFDNPMRGGAVPEGEPVPPYLGTLRTEPVIWVGYAAVDNPSDANQPANRSDPRWDTAFTPKIFGCEHYETEYEVDFNYTGTEQKTTVRNRTFLAPIIDTTFQPGLNTVGGTKDNTTALPISNWLFPQADVQKYRKVAAYHAVGFQFRKFLNGTVEKPGNVLATKAMQTRLLDSHSYLGTKNLMADVQSVYEDILLSIFSAPHFLAVAWAANPSQKASPAAGNDSTLFPCFRNRTDIRFVYHVGDLWGVYSVAILLATCGVVVGVMAVWDEGIMRDTRFSSIAAATRGPALEKLPWGPEGAAPDAKQFKVGYGLVSRGPVDPGSFGFGLAGEVRQTAEGRRQTFRSRYSGGIFPSPSSLRG